MSFKQVFCRTQGLLPLQLTKSLDLTATAMLLVLISCTQCVWATKRLPSRSFVSGYERFHSSGKPTPNGGLLLVSELSCTACHRADSKQPLDAKGGPKLDALARRANLQWVQSFLFDPAKIKPGTTMPSVLNRFPAERRRQVIAALVSYLASGSTAADAKAVHKGRRDQGQKLFHSVGCVACHSSSALDKVRNVDDGVVRPGRPLQRDLVPSVPFPNLTAKYGQPGLAAFLLNPLEVRPTGRMPHLKLSLAEAGDIAAFLTKGKHTPWSTDRKLVEQGRKLYSQLGCADCHSFGKAKSTRQYSSLSQLSKKSPKLNGCLAAAPTPTSPKFTLSVHQRESIRLALTSLKSTKPPSAAAAVERRFAVLNCYACHRRNKKGGVGSRRYPFFETIKHADLGDEGKIPPDLTEVGKKLTEKWLGDVLGGKGEVRPHMVTRMPYFGAAQGRAIARSLLRADQPDRSQTAKAVFPGRVHMNSGRLLTGTGCVQCHAINGKRLPGVLGIDLAVARQRLRPMWFRRFLLTPNRVRPRTRMPSFWLNGKSTNRIILNGDTEAQLASLWAYLSDAARQPLPLAMQKKNTFELRPIGRPIVFRTFFAGAGTHAIAVGYPQELHTVFDSESVRFAMMWRGRFLDAHGTWFNRFQPLTSPLGKSVISLPSGMPLATLKDPKKSWPKKQGAAAGFHMSGYQLSKGGAPTFLYRWNKLFIRDFLRPTATANGMNRSLQFSAPKRSTGTIWFRVITGKKLTPVKVQLKRGAGYQNEKGLKAVTNTPQPLGRVRTINGIQEWLVPVIPKRAKTGWTTKLELEYRW